MGTLESSLVRGDFSPDDYEKINRDYFDEILKSRAWSAFPSGWYNPSCEGAASFSLHLPEARDIIHYAVDEGASLGESRSSIVRLVGQWENRPLEHDEITICPSVSSCNLAVLYVLKEAGIDTILFESPAYYATLQQAELLKMEFIRLPTFRAERFEADLERFESILYSRSNCAIWLTQPRFGIGSNQCLKRLRHLGEILGPRRMLVIDEAAEQMFPSVTSGLSQMRCPVFRTRGIVKGVGLNGIRASVILHPPQWRSNFEEILEAAGASLDRFSLSNVALLADTPMLLPTMLRIANAQVRRERAKLEIMSLGSWMQPTPLENGYIGAIMLDLSCIVGSYARKRSALLGFCKDRRMPIVLGSSIGFAFDDEFEAVRINYFTPTENIEKTGAILLEAGEDLRVIKGL
ncbi:aminotransferase class I/II-fold pyridoxal phosphate-dependent enzyme [Rhodopseudomonas palustris]|nr:aminotransferase class I/II-fold pyridoxal phosphate-dependent enzyme [Rhodopseudomonas palustris]